jgi:parallel beta-helix repeat protein
MRTVYTLTLCATACLMSLFTASACGQARTRTVKAAVCVANNMAGADLGAKINACDAQLGQSEGEIQVSPAPGKAGSIDTQVTVSSLHTLKFAAGTYPSAYIDPGPDGIIRLKSNSKIVGAGWNTILQESSMSTLSAQRNHWTVIINYDGSLSNEATTDNIHITDLQIKGATDSFNSAPQTISLGNCRNCSVERVWLNATKTEGIAAGGSSEGGNYARDVLISDNQFTNVASQNIAVVNGENIKVLNNRMITPGQDSSAAPGCVPIDVEPNSPRDHIRNLEFRGNVIDATKSVFASGVKVLHGILIQNTVGIPVNAYGPIYVTNNRVEGAALSATGNYIAGVGIWINGASNVHLSNNSVSRIYDGIKISSASNFEMINNTVVSCGFTANVAVLIEGTNVSGVVRGNRISVDPTSNLAAGEDADIAETATSGSGVLYTGNQARNIGLSLRGSRIEK